MDHFPSGAPTLGPLGVAAPRVDRIEHNDNIDTRIISEIEAADLVIGDLTYARPSVYFEVGYAQRAIPVIFTANLSR
jgi:nucleoside 2-deoxyribosyltransferase